MPQSNLPKISTILERDRRRFLKAVTVAAGSIAVGESTGPAREFSSPVDGARPGAEFFPQSIASGDPKPGSIILWTRVVDPQVGRRTLRLQVSLGARNRDDALDRWDVEVSPSDRGTGRGQFGRNQLVVDTTVQADAEHDGCVRVKVEGLEPRTRYFYRFLYRTRWRWYSTRTGRAQTAPAPSDPGPVNFAYASCQDFIGKYYNGYLPLLTFQSLRSVDFLVHLGDMIYETTGDPGFQDPGGERTIRFRDEAGAIRLGSEEDPFFAARSLDNYRQLHQTYRSDTVLQAVLENYPIIATWDDHEFTNDSFMDHGTYFDDRQSERDLERKQNAEIAWLEYTPIDDAPGEAGPILDTGGEKLFPNTRIYREFFLGRHLQLVLTDYRTRRPDHLVDEDRFPGEIFASEDELRRRFGDAAFEAIFIDAAQNSLYRRFRPIVDWSDLDPRQRLALLEAFIQEYIDEGSEPDVAALRAAHVLTGQLDADYLNRRLPRWLKMDTGDLPRGVAINNLNKVLLFSAFGARLATDQQFFDLFVRILEARNEDDQNAYGNDQEDFVRLALINSDATWKVIGGSVSNTAMQLDLSRENLQSHLGPGSGFPNLSVLGALLVNTELAKRYYISMDQWDGFPGRREELLDFYRSVGNVVLIDGDIHSSWITDHSNDAGRLREFTGTAISSTTIGGLVQNLVNLLAARGDGEVKRFVQALGEQVGIPDLAGRILDLEGLVDELVTALDAFLIDRTPSSPFRPSLATMRIDDLNTNRNGVVVVEVTGDSYLTKYFLIEPSVVSTRLYDPFDRSTVRDALGLYFALPEGTREQGGLRETKTFRLTAD